MMRISIIVAAATLLAACGDMEEAGAPERALMVTAAEVRLDTVEVVERTVGRIEAATAPTISAEVPGRVVEVLKDAGDAVTAGTVLARIDDANFRNAVRHLEALHDQAGRTAARFRELYADEAVSRDMLDEAESRLEALDAQLQDARTGLERTRIVAPVDGTIQRRMVSVGDFRGVGEPLFELSAGERLRIVLPFPERLSERLTVGRQVRLEPSSGGTATSAPVTELRPMVGVTSRALEAIVELDNPGGWRPGGSVSAAVVLDTREGQALVPAQSVVQRPVGHVVFIVDGDRARQRVVETGVRTNGEVEILSGLARGERVVVDGAGFLTDGTRIDIRR